MPAIGTASFAPGGSVAPTPLDEVTPGSPVASSVGDGAGGGAPRPRAPARGAPGDLLVSRQAISPPRPPTNAAPRSVRRQNSPALGDAKVWVARGNISS